MASFLYMPIDSLPTPPSSPISHLPSNPPLRRQYLLSLLHSLTSTELLFVSATIAPLLNKRDFLSALPPELALHILGFSDEPRTLIRAGRVSRAWRRLVEDDGLWKRMCQVWGFNDFPPGGYSFKEYFKYSYSIMHNWHHGGLLLRAHKAPSSSIDSSSNVVTSLALDSDYVVVGQANCRIHVFSARTGVLARTLVGHQSGVWAVCLVSKGGYMEEDETDDDGGGIPPSKNGKRRKKKRADRARRPSLSNLSRHSENDLNSRNQPTNGTDGFLPPSLRIALGLSSETDDTHIEQAEHGEGEDDSVSLENDERFGGISWHPGSRHPPHPNPYPGKPSSPSGSSEGWGQPDALVVSGGCDKDIRVWDIRSGYCIYTLHGHTSTIRCIKLLHNRPIAVSGSRDTTLRVWDIQKGRLLRTLSGHTGSVRCLDTCGNRVVSGSYDCTCRLWNVDTGECLHILQGHLHQIYSVAFDGVRIASGGLDTIVRVWDAESGECKATLQGHTALVCQLQLSSTMLASGGSDGRVIMFSLPPISHNNSITTTTVSPSLHSSSSFPVCFPTRRTLSTSQPFHQSQYQVLHRLAAHDSSVTSLQFDEHFLVTSGNDGQIKLYETQTGRYIRDLTMDEGLSDQCECVWKVGFASRGGGLGEVLAIMCKRQGKTVMEIWSMKPRDERGRGEQQEYVLDCC